MSDDLLARLRIARLERAPGGWWLLFSWSNDNDVFEAGRDAIKDLPMRDRAWSPEQKSWFVSDAGLRLLRVDVPALDRLLTRMQAQQHQEHEQRQKERIPANIEEAFSALYLTANAPLCMVQAARRVLSRQAHPDWGGTVKAMQRINVAADRCEAWLTQLTNEQKHA